MKIGFEKERVFLKADETRSLIQKKFESVNGMIAEWIASSETNENFPAAPDRGTIYNWIADGFPKHPKRKQVSQNSDLLGFCGLLDADPLALFDYKRNGYDSRFAAIRLAVQRGVGMMGAWRPLFELYQPDEHWPSDFVAKTYWRRPWLSHQFDNQDQYHSNDYAVIKAVFARDCGGDPRTVHIAYRRWDTRRVDTMWRYYGTVIAHNGAIDLYNEGGLHLKMAQSDPNIIQFRTYFGGRNVEFRIVSLHDFNIDIDFPNNDMSIVGFNW